MPFPDRAALLVVLSGLLAGGCARQEPPPGAIPESQPPQIAALYPPRDTVLQEVDGAARVEFDEPISSPGNLRGQLRASPAYRYKVSAGHHGLGIQPEGGWRPGAVYVLELRGSISDLLNNRREEPIRWRFSTGPPVTDTRITGTIWDRVSGEQLNEARAHFLPLEGDSIPYAAVPDSAGTFRLDALPPGRYRAVGFVDRNRNLSLDHRLEPSDSARFALEGPSDRVGLRLVLVEPDSTAPLLGQVEARDSVTVRLTFDDHLLPAQELGGAAVTLRRKGAEDEWPLEAIRVLTREDLPESDATPSGAGDARADTTAPASDTTAPVDSAVAPPDTAVPPFDTTAAPPGSDTTDSPVEPLPTRSLRVRLAEPMVPDTYRIRVRGVQNLRRLAGGGDTTFVYAGKDTIAGDSTAVSGDSAAVLGDSAAVADTAAGLWRLRERP